MFFEPALFTTDLVTLLEVGGNYHVLEGYFSVDMFEDFPEGERVTPVNVKQRWWCIKRGSLETPQSYSVTLEG